MSKWVPCGRPCQSMPLSKHTTSNRDSTNAYWGRRRVNKWEGTWEEDRQKERQDRSKKVRMGHEFREERRQKSKSQERQESELCTRRTADNGKAPSDRWWRNCFGDRGRLLLWRKLAIAVVILLLKTLIKTVSNSKDSIFSLAISLGWSNQGNMKPGWMVHTWIPSTWGRGEKQPDREFKVILSYTVNSGPACSIWACLKTKTNEQTKIMWKTAR